MPSNGQKPAQFHASENVARRRKLSLALIHPRIGRGGSEAFVMWGAQALKRDFMVTLVTSNHVDLDALNRFYGTAVTAADLAVRVLQMPSGLRGITGASALRGAVFQRAIRSVVPDYDVMISAYNFCDFGVAGIQNIVDFSWDEELRCRFEPRGAVDGLIHGPGWFRRSYLGLCRHVASESGQNLFVGGDLILANSTWTAAALRKRHRAIADVLYPPVAGQFRDVLSAQRGNDFVCLGRVSPEKRIERMIRIVGTVRRHGHEDVRIRIVGPLDGSPYSKTVAALARRHSDWVLLEGERMGENKLNILAGCRYGIHGCEGEAFGIAVAEMIKAGCIVFAPVEGGPAEILDDDALLYRGEDDAVGKIVAVMNNPALRTHLTHHLRHQAEKFSAEKFMDGLRKAVEAFMQSRDEAFRPNGRVLSKRGAQL